MGVYGWSLKSFVCQHPLGLDSLSRLEAAKSDDGGLARPLAASGVRRESPANRNPLRAPEAMFTNLSLRSSGRHLMINPPTSLRRQRKIDIGSLNCGDGWTHFACCFTELLRVYGWSLKSFVCQHPLGYDSLSRLEAAESGYRLLPVPHQRV